MIKYTHLWILKVLHYELKGVVTLTIPNPMILIHTLGLQEAKESSAIENIITTEDDLYQSHYNTQQFASIPAKEVHNYAQALYSGYKIVENDRLITNNTIKTIQRTLEENDAGFRTQAGTTLKNEQTGEIIYTPPQDANEIIRLMTDLEKFINENESCNYDDLVKMALIHHQFESIHPFYDGNGRTGRILNILYLVKQDLLEIPILYLSRYINQHKSDYYRLLQDVRVNNNWQDWLIFMLTALEQTARQTVIIIKAIDRLMMHFKHTIKEKKPKLYTHDLLNNLFKHPYTKIEFVKDDLKIHRNTARKYLDSLVEINLLEKHKIGTENFYVNRSLYALLSKEIPNPTSKWK